MNLRQFSNGIRVIWCLSGEEYLACINAEDRKYLGDDKLLERFRKDPLKAFVSLPTQDQVRVFEIVKAKNEQAGLNADVDLLKACKLALTRLDDGTQLSAITAKHVRLAIEKAEKQ